jgi:hypothetical protein
MSTNPDDFLLIPGVNTTLELSTGGAASDIRSWVRDKVGTEGARLFINSIAQSGTSDTLINLHQGSVGIGVVPQQPAKLHVEGLCVIDGGLLVVGEFLAGGPKMFIQAHPEDASLEITYAALEGGEVGTYARGSASLRSGKAVIRLPEHFRLTTDSNGLTAQLTPRGKGLQLFIASLNNGELEVHEAEGRDGQFDYFVQGIRKGFADFQPVRPATLLRPFV